jgi:putative chitinase
MDKKVFFDSVRKSLFYGTLNQSQVNGINAIFDLWDQLDPKDVSIAGLAYIMATSYWEARLPPDWKPRMQPVAEVGWQGRWYAKPDPVTGHIYYGRGDVQLTHADNYKRLGKELGLDLYNNPELALDPGISKLILVKGMLKGLYTPKAGPLSKYFPIDGKQDFGGARAMVNGTDKAAEIADIARKFHNALLNAKADEKMTFLERLVA